MKRRVTSAVIVFVMLLTMFGTGLVLPVYANGSTALPICVSYNSFNSNMLSNNASANTLFYYTSSGYTPNVSSGKLLMTDTSGGEATTVVRRSPIKINQGFSTYFQVDIHNSFQGTGDGLCFIMYDSSSGYQYGGSGGGLGYSNITGDSLAVEMDSYFNGASEFKSNSLTSDTGGLNTIAGSDYLAHHISIDTNDATGDIANVQHDSSSSTDPSTDYNSPTDDGTASIAHYYQNLFDSTSGGGQPTNIWVDLVPISGDSTHAEVIVTYGPNTSRTSTSNYTFKRQISSNLLNDSVYVGFSASTGYSREYHDILCWEFGNTPVTGGIDPSVSYTQAASGITVDTQNVSGSTTTNPTHAVIQIKEADGSNMNSVQNVIVSVDGGSLSTIMTDANGTLDFDLSGLSPASHTITATTADGSAQSSKTFTVTSIVQLSAPNNVAVTSAGAVSWGNSDSNASSFTVKVYKDGVVAPVKTINNATSGTTSLLPSDYIGSGTGNYDVTVTAVGDHTIYNDSAESTKAQNMSVHSVSLTITGGNGTDSVQVGSNGAVTSASSVPYYYFGGSDVTITATPASGRKVTWQDNSTSNSFTVTGLSVDEAITAAFTAATSADLANIILSGSPTGFTFAGSTYTYNGVTVANGVSSITVTPTGAGTITVDGTQVNSGEASAAIDLTPGVEKTVSVVATETGKTAKTYTIKVTRQLSSDATLKSTTTIKGVTVTDFGTPSATTGGTTSGTVTLTAVQGADTSNAGSYITSFVVNDAAGTVSKIVKYASGGSTANFDTTDTAYNGTDAITNGDFFIVKVTAQDSTVSYYRITVTVDAPLSSDAGLTSVLSQSITAGAGAGTSGAPKTASISVANAVSTVAAADIIKHDAGATVTFYGTDSTFTTPAVGSVNLTAGSGTDVYIKVAAADDTTLYYKVTINRASAHSSGGSTSSTPTQPTESGVEILVNGKVETAATATTTQEGDQTVTTVIVDDKKVEEKLQAEGNNAIVTIPVKNDADVVVGQLNGQTVKNMETKEAVLEIKTENVTYTLPASQINIDNVSEQIGKQVELKDIKVNVAISAPPQDTVKVVEDTANNNNYQVVVKPVEFEITCTSGNKTVEVSKFNGYVERMVAIPDGVDPSKITTGIVLNSDGTFSHVPTAIIILGGKYYARINSLTNSTYSVIYSPETFKDVEKHWAKDAVNDMGSRLVVSGVGNDMFEPDRDITRGEFAAIVVRALGLMRPGTGKASFGDVSKNDWYYDAVSIAYENGIISGYGNGKFGPMDKITREQAMTMIARAMKITGLKSEIKDSEISSLLANYADGAAASTYAKTSIAACLKTGVITGRNGSSIAPKNYITRAEVAVIVQRLLQKSNLI